MPERGGRITDSEFHCLLAISSDAFDIHSFLVDLIRGQKIDVEGYRYLLDTACELMDYVKTVGDILGQERTTSASQVNHAKDENENAFDYKDTRNQTQRNDSKACDRTGATQG